MNKNIFIFGIVFLFLVFPFVEGVTTWTKTYTGTPQNITINATGLYKVELYGARGGSYSSYRSQGGYTKGYLNLTNGQVITIFVGQDGTAGISAGTLPNTYNGGGGRAVSGGNSANRGSGGGATDLRIGNYSSNVSDYARNNRVLVAGGSGGGGSTSGYSYVIGGLGGGSSGTAGQWGSGGAGGTQTTGNALGQGGYANTFARGGGGGGYYGGYANTGDGAGGGGSGYIGGITNYRPSTNTTTTQGAGGTTPKAIITLIAVSGGGADPCAYSGTGNFVLSQSCTFTTPINIQTGFYMIVNSGFAIFNSGGFLQ